MRNDIWHQKEYIDFDMTLTRINMKKSVLALAFSFSILLTFGQTITKDELLGKINPAKHTDFALIQSVHTTKANIYLRKATYDSFIKMYNAALKDGVKLTIISATRNFDAQKAIWEKKWLRPQYKGKSDVEKASDIMKYSSMPGTSRHHWGTDIDMNSLENSYFTSGEGKKMYEWLVKNAATYGFYQTYTSKSNGRTGYEEEKWHWSYKPLSEVYLQEYKKQISYTDLVGFSGCSAAQALKVIEVYVCGIE
jgi:LAS superfamily LD-carboxypeptidase LdcB